MKTKYESVIRMIAIYLTNREYKKARHHLKRLLNRPDLTEVEKEVLQEQALVAFNK